MKYLINKIRMNATPELLVASYGTLVKQKLI